LINRDYTHNPRPFSLARSTTNQLSS
jgi:hypothetical protein